MALLLFFYGSFVAFFSLSSIYNVSPALALKSLASTVIQISCLLPLCLSFDRVHQYLSQDKRGFIYISLLPLIVVVIDGVFRGREVYGTWELYQQEGAPLVYLAMSDAFAVIGLLVYIYAVGLYKYFYLVVSLFGIYYTYSRSSLYFFIISIVVFEIFVKRNILFLFSSILGVCFLFVMAIFGSSSNSRFLVLLTDPWSDPSFVGRLNYFKEGMEVISNNFIFGSYGYEILRDGDSGGYIHNLLSYWAAYGIAYFLIFLFIIVLVFIYIFCNLKFFRSNVYFHFPVLMFVYAFFSSLISKAYVWPFLWFSLILVCSLDLLKKQDE